MRTTRPKKLTSKQPVPIYREDQIDLAEDDPQNTLQAVETGVEKAEETVSAIFLPNPPRLRGSRHVIRCGEYRESQLRTDIATRKSIFKQP